MDCIWYVRIISYRFAGMKVVLIHWGGIHLHEVNVAGAFLHPRWCRFSPHREVALHWMSIPGEDNSQSITLILCSLDHSQWGGLHVYLNMIIVVNNLFYFLFLFMIILLCFGKSPLYFVVVCCVGRIGPPCYDGARGRCVCWWWCCCG